MPQPVNWFLFDNFIAAEELARRIGTWCNLVDDSGPSWVWGPLYVSPDAENPTRFLVQCDGTLFTAGAPKTWAVAPTFQNNPYHYMIAQDSPLLTAADLAQRQVVDFSEFVELPIPEPEPEA